MAELLEKPLYVDDLITEEDNVGKAFTIYKKSKQVLKLIDIQVFGLLSLVCKLVNTHSTIDGLEANGSSIQRNHYMSMSCSWMPTIRNVLSMSAVRPIQMKCFSRCRT